MYAVSTLVMNHRDLWEDTEAPVQRLLQEFHKNAAFEDGSFHDLAWTLSVDLFAFAMLFWLASGFWLWWKMPRTRSMGSAFLAVGLLTFVFFVVSL